MEERDLGAVLRSCWRPCRCFASNAPRAGALPFLEFGGTRMLVPRARTGTIEPLNILGLESL
jgi:hypothetical protein